MCVRTKSANFWGFFSSGAWFNGRTSVSKTADEGSIPSAPASFLGGGGLVVTIKTLRIGAFYEEIAEFYQVCSVRMVQDCMAITSRGCSCNHNDIGVFGRGGTVFLCD